MAYILELEPIGIEGKRLVPDTPEEAVLDGYAGHLCNSLAAMVVQPGFDPAAVPETFAATIDEYTPAIIKEVLKFETNWSSDSFKKLTVKIGDLMLQGVVESPDQVEIDPRFSKDLKQQARTMTNPFDILSKYNQSLAANNSLSLVHDIWRLTVDRPEGWLDASYELAEEAMLNSDFTPQLDDPDSLYLITFMPHIARRLTRRVLVGNFMTAAIQKKLADTPDDDSLTMLRAYKDYIATDALSGQQWNDLAKHYQLSEEHSMAMGLLSAKQLNALALMQQIAKDGRGKSFIDSYKAVRDGLRQTIGDAESAGYRIGLATWAGEDIGHCFHNFSDWEIDRLLGEGALTERDFNPAEKTGGKMVILEDDIRQLAAWQQVFGDHSVFEVSQSHSFTSPEGIEELFTDPEVSLFLLDIQNGQDETAGIRVADALVRKRLSILAQVADPSTLKPVRIMVWSSSHAATKAAHQQLSALLNNSQLNPGGSDYVGYSGGGCGTSSGRHRIIVEVKQKELRAHDLRQVDY